ncbi:MAG TPA: zf-HC2 domain-containing protein [Ktedonobacteraceae bacterium]|nr:zf-HC2 domain-containing protein [Ktedonobacteraceae bacterium]
MNTPSTFLTPCPLWAEKLAATHPDDLTPIERQELQVHLATCPTCAAIRAEYEIMGRYISRLPVADPGPGLPPALLHMLHLPANQSAWMPSSTEHTSQAPCIASLPPSTTRRHRRNMLIQTIAAVLIVGALLGSFFALFASHRTNTAQNGYTKTWHVIPSPNPGAGSNLLQGVAAFSANDAWAVGSTASSSTVPAKSTQTLIEHWNGKQWSVVPSPNSSMDQNTLVSIIARSPNDIWAIGTAFSSPSETPQPLVEHWNGKQWSILNTGKLALRPNVNPQINILTGIAFIAPDNIWTVGTSDDEHRTTTLIEHWNGKQWSIIPSPNPGVSRNELRSITAITPNDIWAAGLSAYGNSATLAQTLVEHWNGSRWSIVPTPPIGSSDNYLNAISAISASDIWTIGVSSNDEFSAAGQPLIEHWNGSQWNIVKSPTLQNSFLGTVMALSAHDVWATGTSFQNGNPATGTGHALLLHWDGSQWSLVTTPDAGSGTEATLTTLSLIPGSNSIWAVGSSNQTNSQHASTFTALYY